MKLPVLLCSTCAIALARPLGAWVLTDLLPFQHHALLGLALAVLATWRAIPFAREPESAATDCQPIGSK